MIHRNWFAALALMGLSSCSGEPPSVRMHGVGSPPSLLSAWGLLLVDGNALQLNSDVHRYELNTPLFSDYARKLRTIWLPAGESIGYRSDGVLDFPVGTIISKTFYYESAGPAGRVVRDDRDALLTDDAIDLKSHLLIETRLLIRYDEGWKALPYVWNDDQTDATLEIAGDLQALTLVDDGNEEGFTYVVPDINQCGGCHTPDHSSGDLRPLGPKAWQLNRDRQLENWAEAGLLKDFDGAAAEGPRWANRDQEALTPVARAYLDANCAHCHNPDGPADTSALHLNREAPLDRNFGLCKSPVAVGRGSGDRLYDIYPGAPDESIVVYRMQHADPAIAMPELGRSVVHAEGVAVISAWIASLEGDC